jgi:hypothetical protein
MASCPSDVNKKVMLTVCFSCFSVPILKENNKEFVLTVLPCTNITLTSNTWHAFSDQMLSMKKGVYKNRSDIH